MIIDSSLYFNEEEAFLLRYSTLYSSVDAFLVLEGTRTFSGKRRDPKFPFETMPKVIYRQYEDDTSGTAWESERAHRRALWHYILQFTDSDHDIVLLSDGDEIAHPAAIKDYVDRLAPFHSVGVMDQLISYYFLNVRGNIQWQGTRISTVRGIVNKFAGDLQLMRQAAGDILRPGGWHFSFLGGVKAIQEKLRAYAHTEYDTIYWTDPARLQEVLQELLDPFERPITWRAIPVDGSFPEPVQEDPSKYRDLLHLPPSVYE